MRLQAENTPDKPSPEPPLIGQGPESPSQQGAPTEDPPNSNQLLALSPWQPIPMVSQDLHIPGQTIRTWIRRHQVRTIKIHGILLVNRADCWDRQMNDQLDKQLPRMAE